MHFFQLTCAGYLEYLFQKKCAEDVHHSYLFLLVNKTGKVLYAALSLLSKRDSIRPCPLRAESTTWRIIGRGIRRTSLRTEKKRRACSAGNALHCQQTTRKGLIL